MSDIKRCDRCGSASDRAAGGCLWAKVQYNNRPPYDICENCSKAFERFMLRKEEAER